MFMCWTKVMMRRRLPLPLTERVSATAAATPWAWRIRRNDTRSCGAPPAIDGTCHLDFGEGCLVGTTKNQSFLVVAPPPCGNGGGKGNDDAGLFHVAFARFGPCMGILCSVIECNNDDDATTQAVSDL